jgi:hypothetical protein
MCTMELEKYGSSCVKATIGPATCLARRPSYLIQQFIVRGIIRILDLNNDTE